MKCKRVLSAVMAAALCVSLAACGSTASSSQAASTAESAASSEAAEPAASPVTAAGGLRVAGLPGMLTATLGCILPSLEHRPLIVVIRRRVYIIYHSLHLDVHRSGKRKLVLR